MPAIAYEPNLCETCCRSGPRREVCGGLGRGMPGEDNPEEELLFRGLWEDETQRDVLIESFKALQCIEDIFNEIGDEKLALIFFPNGLDGDKGDLEEIAKALEEHGITRELWDASLGEANDPAEIQARFDESERRLIEPRKERIWYHARKMNDV